MVSVLWSVEGGLPWAPEKTHELEVLSVLHKETMFPVLHFGSSRNDSFTSAGQSRLPSKTAAHFENQPMHRSRLQFGVDLSLGHARSGNRPHGKKSGQKKRSCWQYASWSSWQKAGHNNCVLCNNVLGFSLWGHECPILFDFAIISSLVHVPINKWKE